MKTVSGKLGEFTQHDIAQFEKQGHYIMDLGEEEVELLLSEVEITSEDIPGWSVASKGSLTVALDINLTPELEQEGDAREFVNRIQRLRKDSGLELTDRIVVEVAANNGIKASLERYNSYICAEILADKLDIKSDIDGGTEIDVNDNLLKVTVLKNG